MSQRKIRLHFDSLFQLRDGLVVLPRIVMKCANLSVDDERKRIQFQSTLDFPLGFFVASENHQHERIPMTTAGVIGI